MDKNSFSHKPFENNVELSDPLIEIGRTLQSRFMEDISSESLQVVNEAGVFDVKGAARIETLSRSLLGLSNPRDLELLVSLTVFEALDLQATPNNWQDSPFFAELKDDTRLGDIVLWNLRCKKESKKKSNAWKRISPVARKGLLSLNALGQFAEGSDFSSSSRNPRRFTTTNQVRNWMLQAINDCDQASRQ